MLKQKYFLADIFILSAEKQPIKLSWRKIVCLQYMPDTNFKGWVYTIMRNIFINNYRKSLRDQTYVDQTDNQFYLNQGAGLEADSMEGAYDLKEMRRVVNALPKDYRIPFAMYVSGFKYREIADKLGLPLGTVKSRIYFTRQRLQEELKDFR